jgi:thymidylate synthase (FAD)
LEAKVTLISHTPGPDKIADASARLSQTDKSPYDIYNTHYEKKVIKNVMKMGHTSVAEHAYFNFAFDNVSVIVEHFLIEFRLGSYTVKSRRYVDFRNAGFIIPEYLDSSEFSDFKKEFSDNASSLFNSYSKLADLGIEPEDARFILPYCFKSSFILSMNARELIHAISSMVYGRGKDYPEIKKTGELMLCELQKKAPLLFSDIKDDIKTEDKWDRLTLLLKGYKDSVKVDNRERVEVLYHTEDAENAVIKSIFSLLGKDAENASAKLKSDVFDILIKDKRGRELELAGYTFIFRDITYPFLTHLIRHRMHSPVVLPFSYTDYQKVIIPPKIKKNQEAFNIFNEGYNKNLKEDLVYSRIAGNVVDVITNMNARELFHFIGLRTCQRAQWEIREYAEILTSKLKKISPLLFKNAGPGCVLYGKCPEGKYSCGLAKEKRELFKNI